MPRFLNEKESMQQRLRGAKFSEQPVRGFEPDEPDEPDAVAMAIAELVRHHKEVFARLEAAERTAADNQRLLAQLLARQQVSVEKMINGMIQADTDKPNRPRRIKLDIQRNDSGKIKSLVANIIEE